MNKWQKQVQQSLLKSEEDVIKQLKKQYRSALSDIMAKVEQYDADIKNIDIALENTALDDNARAVLLSQRQSKIYQKQYQETLKAQISGIIDKLNADNYTAINDYLNGTYNDAFVGTVYDMANQGVPFIMPVNQAAVTNAVLINSKISGGLYEALGINAKKLKKRIAEEISRGIAQNMSYTDIARNLVNTSGIGINNAVRIIRTEGHRIQQTATHDAQIQAKAKGADVLKQWDASLDGKTRPLHRLLDGQIREVEEPFEADGIKVDRPGEFGIASQDINCRCAVMTRARWALDENELQILKDRATYYGLDKSKEFDDFKKKYISAIKDIEDSDNSGIIDIVIDELTPCLRDIKTGELVETVVETITDRTQLKGFNKTNGWYINWQQIPKDCTICALKVKDNDTIQGLVSYKLEPNNKAAYAYWLVSAPHNRGTDKQYSGVGGHLFAVIANASVDAGYGGFLYGIASNDTVLKHYIDTLGATPLDERRFFIDEDSSQALLNIYNFEKGSKV